MPSSKARPTLRCVEERVLALQEKKRWLSTTLLGDAPSAPALGEAEIEALFAPIEG